MAERDPREVCKCGKPHDGWPGSNGGELCQMCWEAECSESWWRMVEAFPGAASEVPNVAE